MIPNENVIARTVTLCHPSRYGTIIPGDIKIHVSMCRDCSQSLAVMRHDWSIDYVRVHLTTVIHSRLQVLCIMYGHKYVCKLQSYC